MNGAVVIGSILKKGNTQFDKTFCLFLCSLVVPASKIIRYCYRKYFFLFLEKILKSLLLEFGCLVQTEQNTSCVLIKGDTWQNVVFLKET